MDLAALKRKNANLASEVRRLKRELERARSRRTPEPGPLHFERALLRRLDGQQIAEIAGLTIRIQEPEIPGDPIAASASISRLVFTTSEMATWQNMSFNGLPECTLEALDRYDDSVLLTLTGAVLSGRSTSFQTNQRIVSDLSMLATGAQHARKAPASQEGQEGASKKS